MKRGDTASHGLQGDSGGRGIHDRRVGDGHRERHMLYQLPSREYVAQRTDLLSSAMLESS
jgi:hypothetical protein